MVIKEAQRPREFGNIYSLVEKHIDNYIDKDICHTYNMLGHVCPHVSELYSPPRLNLYAHELGLRPGFLLICLLMILMTISLGILQTQ